MLDHVAGAMWAHAAQHMSPWLQVSSYDDVRSSARWLKLLASHHAAGPKSQRSQGAVSIKKYVRAARDDGACVVQMTA